jgi:formate hydrogenlyase subunit 6/NADH:ubiquinone oxidoreductase subunit I
VDVARYFVNFLMDESCGKCTPCREGLCALHAILTRICDGEGDEKDLPLMEEIAATMSGSSLCQLGATAANPVLSTMKYFREEYEEHITRHRCRAGVCKPLISYHINEACTGCTLCALKCPTKAISGERKALHVIDAGTCIKCGICYEVCKFDAVEVK